MISGAVLEIVNLDEEHESNTVKSIDINDVPYATVADRELFDRSITTVYGDDFDQLDVPASCNCISDETKLTGIEYRGNVCPHCNTIVDYDHLKGYEHNMWIRTPACLPSLIHPLIFTVLYEKLVANGAKNWSGLMWLIKTTYREPPTSNYKAYEFCQDLKKAGFKRGLENFPDQYDKITAFILARMEGSNDYRYWLQFFTMAKKNAQTYRLPVPTKISLVLKNTSLGNFSEKSLQFAKDAIIAVATLDETKSVANIGNRMAEVMESLYFYIEEVTKESYTRKGQVARGLLYGTVTEFTCRAVITSKTEAHRYDEIDLPYSELVVLLEVHIMNILVKRRDWGFKQALDYVNTHKGKRDPYLVEIIEILFKESVTGRGIYCLLTRYPSLDKGSTRLFLVSGISDGTIRLSVLAVKASNADFDGDNKSLSMLFSEQEVKDAMPFHPCRGIHDLSSPGNVDHDMQLPDPTVINMYSFLEEEDLLIEAGAI